MNRAAATLSWSSLLATLHSLLTSQDRQDEHSWTKTALNKTVQFARKPHAVNMLQREGEHLVVEGSMLEIVRPVLELVLVSWALDRDSNNSFLHPGILATQVLSFVLPMVPLLAKIIANYNAFQIEIVFPSCRPF